MEQIVLKAFEILSGIDYSLTVIMIAAAAQALGIWALVLVALAKK